jgi:hypothetical protein
VDLAAYREDAETFVSALGREHYRHFAGLKPSLEIEPIYERHAELFTARAVEEVRSGGSPALLEFCVEGFIGRATTRETAELAEREASLELELDGPAVPFRQAAIEQANEPDPGRRAAIETERLEATERELDPLLRAVRDRTDELADELGWPDVRSMCADLSGIDLRAMEQEMEELLEATAEEYDRFALPRIAAELGVDRPRRSDLPAFFRAGHLDEHFPESKLLASLTGTLEGLGLETGERVKLDTERRPTKSPRAFCVPVMVPDEVYLVISPHGGRDDYEALLHEAGHAHHYASVASELDFERRHLGDNSVTESYAFLLQRLATEPKWLERHLQVDSAPEVAEHARAAKLVFLRRYAAKLGYEIELHASQADAAGLRRSYSRRLSDALRLDWPEETWLADVDPFFYAGRYLRAWSLEASLTRDLRTRHGPAWFAEPEAGVELARLWSQGQPARAEDLMGSPDPSALVAELAPGG